MEAPVPNIDFYSLQATVGQRIGCAFREPHHRLGDTDTFDVAKKARTVAVKNRDNPKPTSVPNFKDYLLYRKADIKDFVYLLNYPEPNV